jgi:hypothetical protein
MKVADNERPPYVTFERRAVEDRNASQAAGHYVAKDVDFVTITRAGSSDNLEQEVATWFAELEKRVRQSQFPSEWLRQFREAYRAWSEGEEIPETGTPIKTWPPASPAQIKSLLAVGIRTVEDLASLPDSELPSIGMGAIALKQRAAAWLSQAASTGRGAEEVAQLRQRVLELESLVAQFTANAAQGKPAPATATTKA